MTNLNTNDSSYSNNEAEPYKGKCVKDDIMI